MLSASDVEGEALKAGADVFLRKPDDIGKLAETASQPDVFIQGGFVDGLVRSKVGI